MKLAQGHLIASHDCLYLLFYLWWCWGCGLGLAYAGQMLWCLALLLVIILLKVEMPRAQGISCRVQVMCVSSTPC